MTDGASPEHVYYSPPHGMAPVGGRGRGRGGGVDLRAAAHRPMGRAGAIAYMGPVQALPNANGCGSHSSLCDGRYARTQSQNSLRPIPSNTDTTPSIKPVPPPAQPVLSGARDVPVSWMSVTCTSGGWNAVVMKGCVLFVLGIAAVLLISNPIGWLLIAFRVHRVRVHAHDATGLMQLTTRGVVPFRQMAEFETSAFMRNHGFKGTNYHLIYEAPTGRRLFLGSLPDFKRDDVNRFVADGIGAVFSVNEPWEREPIAGSDPVTHVAWAARGISYGKLDVYDHSYLTEAQLDTVSEFIGAQFADGRNVYVHCRAGVGRSAMAVGYYLIRYCGFTALGAAAHIKARRPQSNIINKLKDVEKHGKIQRGLSYYATLPTHGLATPDGSVAFSLTQGGQSLIDTATFKAMPIRCAQKAQFASL